MVWVNTWTDDADDALMQKRNVENKHMKIIAAEMGRSLRGCYDRYAKLTFLRKPDLVVIPHEPEPPRRILSLHERLGIATFVHRQAVLFDPAADPRKWGSSHIHWYRYPVTLACCTTLSVRD